MSVARAALASIAALHVCERIEPEVWDMWSTYERCSTCGGERFPCPTRAIVDSALAADDEKPQG